MNLLLDTGPLGYWLYRPDRLGRQARKVLDGAGSSLCTSAATIYEIRQKVMLTSWRDFAEYEMADLAPALMEEGIEVLPLTGEIMDRACDFSWHHRDPFDRMILATARVRGMTLVSEDPEFDTLAWDGYRRIWD